MSTSDIADDITDREAFSTALSRLIESAEDNAVSVQGGYNVDTGGQQYGVEIYRVEPP